MFESLRTSKSEETGARSQGACWQCLGPIQLDRRRLPIDFGVELRRSFCSSHESVGSVQLVHLTKIEIFELCVNFVESLSLASGILWQVLRAEVLAAGAPEVQTETMCEHSDQEKSQVTSMSNSASE